MKLPKDGIDNLLPSLQITITETSKRRPKRPRARPVSDSLATHQRTSQDTCETKSSGVLQSIRNKRFARCLKDSYPNANIETILRNNGDAWLIQPTSLLDHKALLNLLHRQQYPPNTEIDIYVTMRYLDRRDAMSTILKRIYGVALVGLYPKLTRAHGLASRIHAGGHAEGSLNDIQGRIGRFRRYGYRWCYIIMKCKSWSGVLLLLGDASA